MADTDQVRATSEYLVIPRSFIRREDIDSYANYLQAFVTDLVAKTVPLSKSGSREGRNAPWWTAKVTEAVRAERRARRQHAHPDILSHLRRCKRKAIRDARTETWRAALHAAHESHRGIWNLEQASTLHEQFFPAEPDIEPIPLPDNPPPTVEDPPAVTDIMVAAALRNMASWKAPGPDGIPVGFLKAMGDPLICALRVLTQAFWDWQHFPAPFKISRTVVIKKPRKETYSAPKS
ncbi:hypothetical protein VTN31DRAFT_2373 [Thermomyces dupontii]|uniref:uncharacterized protein n=1 Tax=Talaromyces thermophilus TaxID=28565 RepID=UPI0037443F6B